MGTNNSDPMDEYYRGREERIASNKKDQQLIAMSNAYIKELSIAKYVMNFSWLGRPIIQLPQDLMALQEIMWDIKPDYVIETGIAHGGSLIFYASILELIGKGTVIGIDIDIRSHNRAEIEGHRLARRIKMIEGSSTSQEVVDKVKSIVSGGQTAMVCLDSNHTHDHVLQELELYTSFVSIGSYCVVFDTGIEDMPPEQLIDRPWGPGNNPKTAVWQFLKNNDRFEIDKHIEHKLLLTAAPDGYLRRIK